MSAFSFHLGATLLALVAMAALCGQCSAKFAIFSSNSGATKPQKARPKESCPENMVEITNKAFKHALKKDIYETKKPQSAEAFERLNFSTCAVVGNGGTLKTTKYGKSIDSHEVVFRANQAPYKSYENIVGSKTTFRILNKRWLGTYSAGVGYLPLEKGVFLTTSRGDQKVVDTLYRKHKDNAKVNVITMSSKISGASRKVLEEFKDYVKCHKRGKAFHGGSTISSGLYEVFMALALCDKVTVYGFGNGGHGLYQYYQFRNTERRRGDSVHSFDAEKALIMQLERDGFLKTCFGKTKEGNDCGNQHKASGGSGPHDKDKKKHKDKDHGATSAPQGSPSAGGSHQSHHAPSVSPGDTFSSADQALGFLKSIRGEDDDDVVDHDEVDKHLEEMLDSHEEDHEEIGIDHDHDHSDHSDHDDHDDHDDQSTEEVEEGFAEEEEE